MTQITKRDELGLARARHELGSTTPLKLMAHGIKEFKTNIKNKKIIIGTIIDMSRIYRNFDTHRLIQLKLRRKVFLFCYG